MIHHCNSNRCLSHRWRTRPRSSGKNHPCNNTSPLNRTLHSFSPNRFDSRSDRARQQKQLVRVQLPAQGRYFYGVSLRCPFPKRKLTVQAKHTYTQLRQIAIIRLASKDFLNQENTAAEIGWTAIQRLNRSCAPIARLNLNLNIGYFRFCGACVIGTVNCGFGYNHSTRVNSKWTVLHHAFGNDADYRAEKVLSVYYCTFCARLLCTTIVSG